LFSAGFILDLNFFNAFQGGAIEVIQISLRIVREVSDYFPGRSGADHGMAPAMYAGSNAGTDAQIKDSTDSAHADGGGSRGSVLRIFVSRYLER
jgi:hypothetical protein